MTPSLAVLCVSALAVVAFTISALSAPAVALLGPGRLGLSARAEARVLFSLAVAPAVLSLATVGASLLPFAGLESHHCLGGLDPHAHPHLCVDHHQGQWPGTAPLLLGSLLLARMAVAALVWARNWRTAALLACRLPLIAERQDWFWVLPLREPQAFLLGWSRPELLVTRGLFGTCAAHADAVLAHERAHLERRDPLARAVAKLALAFHLPFVAGGLERALCRAQEMAADAEAAERVGGTLPVAQALIELSRASLPRADALTAFGASDVERRVYRLLSTTGGVNSPSARVLSAVAVAAVLALFLAAEPVHHALELALDALGHDTKVQLQ